VREGLRSLLTNEPDIEVIAEAESGMSTLKLVQETSPDIVIMDVAMTDLNGIEATHKILTINPDIKVIALSMYTDKRFVMGMLRAGASAYLPKDCAFEELAQAIHTVAANKTYLSSSIVDIVVKDYFHHLEDPDTSAFSVLTSREREVLQLLAEGKAIREVAGLLSLSVKTIETYRQQIMAKLGVHGIAELTKYAVREGLTSLET